jgi:hypothetical protein
MDNKYAGMTVNERLYVSGLLDKFDKAVNEKNIEEVVSILKNIELNNLSISPILGSLGLVKDGEGLL